VSPAIAAIRRRVVVGAGEAGKLPAFLRRDLLVMLSYRVAFVGDLVFICVQAVLFYFVAQIVDPAQLPTYGGTAATYMEFVMIGVVISTVSGLLLQRVATAIRQEQMIGTLEALLMSPTSPATIQAGSIAFDLLFIPVRMGVLLGVVALAFGLDFQAAGVIPALVVFGAFMPFVWGLGLMAASAILTFRRAEHRPRAVADDHRPGVEAVATDPARRHRRCRREVGMHEFAGARPRLETESHGPGVPIKLDPAALGHELRAIGTDPVEHRRFPVGRCMTQLEDRPGRRHVHERLLAAPRPGSRNP